MVNTRNNQSEINVGVDTGKHQLDIFIRPLDIYFSISNDDKGIKKQLLRLKNITQHLLLLKQQDVWNIRLFLPALKRVYPLLLPTLYILKSSQELLAD